MKYAFTFLIYLFLVSFNVPTTWKLDTVHSNLGFALSHLNVSMIKGTFKMKEAQIVATGDDLSDASISLELDVTSIDTDNDKRDGHLRTADFFDTEKYPSAFFKSTSCKKIGDMKYSVEGELDLHGVKKPIKLEMVVKWGINPNNDKPIYGIKVNGTFKRTDFGIAASTPPEILGDETSIEAFLEFSKAE